VTPFLDELGKRLAERWLATLVVPGVLFLAVATVAVTLGHGNALDGHDLATHTAQWTTAVSHWPVIGQAAALIAVVLGSIATATTIRAIADGAMLRLWLGQWPRSLAELHTARRATRWHRLLAELAARRDVAAPAQRTPELLRSLENLSAQRDRIALATPTTATFTGDRLAGIATRVRNQYGIDLVHCWLRLWVLFPEDVRAELRTARSRLDTAVTGTTWAAAYAVLACVWWPASIAAVAIGLISWRRGRRAADDHAALVESTVDLFLPRLAVELGVAEPGSPMDPEIGVRITRIARKGV